MCDQMEREEAGSADEVCRDERVVSEVRRSSRREGVRPGSCGYHPSQKAVRE